MRYKIVYDRPGRMRVRCGAGVFTAEQGYGIADLLREGADAHKVEVCPINGSVLICYPESNRQTVLAILNGLRRCALPNGKPRDNDIKREIDNDFLQETSALVVGHFVKKLLPPPLRLILTLKKALSFWKEGADSLLSGRLDVPVLDASSIGAAFCQRDMKTAGSIMFMLKISELLENYTRKRTTTILTQSLAVNVDSLWIVGEDGAERQIPMSEVKKGSVARIRTGSLIPVDGTVKDGDAMVNEASMTGEAVPVHKKKGVSVYAGTVVTEGSIDVIITALPSESRIQQIVGLIENSENLKAGVQNRAEHLADKIVPFSFAGALAAGLLTGKASKALSVFMVDYSCGIKLSASISVISAMREAASRKIMVKGGKFMEAFAQADTIIFDKTGTLTEACPKVSGILPFGSYSEEEILKTAACIEEHFPHSMARAVVRAAEERGLTHEERHADVEYVVAHGVVTRLDGKRTLIGSAHFVFEDENTLYTEEQKKAVDEAAGGGSALYLAIGGELAGVIFVNDPPRKEAAEAIACLKARGIKNVIMLTGDSESAAKAVSKQLGIDDYRSQVLPSEKAEIVESYKKQGRKVIMVGDGVNDSPALAAADVSVSMKDSSDIAREVADITLLSADLRELVVLRELSGRLFVRIDKNYKFIISFNTALLLMGLTGMMAPGRTAVLHNASTMGISALSTRPLIRA
jgi:heavy metal translocating P-type ATPase